MTPVTPYRQNDKELNVNDSYSQVGSTVAKNVILYDEDGVAIPNTAAKVQTLLDDVTTTSMTYVGTAPIGTATSAGAWTIKRIDESGTPTTLAVKYATAGASTCIWDNRASLTYT